MVRHSSTHNIDRHARECPHYIPREIDVCDVYQDPRPEPYPRQYPLSSERKRNYGINLKPTGGTQRGSRDWWFRHLRQTNNMPRPSLAWPALQLPIFHRSSVILIHCWGGEGVPQSHGGWEPLIGVACEQYALAAAFRPRWWLPQPSLQCRAEQGPS